MATGFAQMRNKSFLECFDNKTGKDIDSIDTLFQETTVFVTGATGFVGKVLVEKLLRSCRGIKTVYILLRPKAGVTADERYETYLQDRVFDRLRIESNSMLRKLFYISGDITIPYLGVTKEDAQLLLENVNIVFHTAATVKFNEELKKAANLNARGTKRLLDLCVKMTKLKGVVHVSTAYCNPGRKYIEEEIYRHTIPVDKDYLLKYIDDMPFDTYNRVSILAQGAHPNTYTMTKSIAEQIVYEYSHRIPVCIIRPSIITAAIANPCPGWIDNIQGITGIMMEIGRGTISSIIGDKNCICDIVPVDLVVNTMIGAAWTLSNQRFHKFYVYNCTSGQIKSITWNQLGYLTKKWARLNPSKYVVFYPSFSFRTNEKIHKLYELLFHFLPALLLDVLIQIQGSTPIMSKIARRLHSACETGKFFALNEWVFENKNQINLAKVIQSLKDGTDFNSDISTINYDLYIRNYMLGIRKFILKDDETSLNTARKKVVRIYWIRLLIQILALFGIVLVIIKYFEI